MKKLLLTTALVLLVSPVLAKEYVIKEISDPAGDKPYYFSPDKLTIQPGDTVTFVNAQEDTHDVMFISVPKSVKEMIMSPMHEKEGDKFSYTFTVSGTYQFHCHPHEALGMKGTLIVGQASKPGETVMMDHHKMARIFASSSGHAAPVKLAHGTGTLNSIDAKNHTINLTHSPIKDLGWPKMRMEFSVDPSVDLSGFKEGDTVSFALKPVASDDYTIVSLKK